MAWLYVKILEDEFDEDSRTGRGRGRFKYLTESDTVVSTDAHLLASAGGITIKKPGESYSSGRPSCTVDSRRVWRDPKHKLTQRYLELQFRDPELVALGDLLSQPALVWLDDEIVLEEYAEDEGDPPAPVQNASGEPYDHGPQRKIGWEVYTVKKYVNAATREAIRDLKWTNNSQAMEFLDRVHDEETLLLSGAIFEPVPGRTDVMLATVRIEYQTDGWVDKGPNVGFQYLYKVTDSGKFIRRDIESIGADGVTKVAVAKPVALDANGQPKDADDDSVETIDFFPYPNGSWGVLASILRNSAWGPIVIT